MNPFTITNIADAIGGDSATRSRRARTLGRVAMNLSDIASDNPLQEWQTAFKHATAAKLYSRDAVCWAAVFFYQTEILGLTEQVAAYQALVPLPELKRAIAGVIVGESWTLNFETESYPNRVGCRYSAQVNSNYKPFASQVSANKNAVITLTSVSLNQLLKPVLSRISKA
jgi:hypothetical protein